MDESPWAMFIKLDTGRVSQVKASRQTSRLWLLKCGLTGAKIEKNGNFWCKYAPKEYIPLSDFYKIWHAKGTSRPAPSCKNLTIVTYEMWAYSPQIAEINIFGISLPNKGIPPWAIFVKFGLGRESQVRTRMPNFTVLALKWGTTASKIAQKIEIFGINLPLRENFGGAHKKLNMQLQTTTTNLPLCNNAIIVLKITLLRSVAVITNLVIPKRDKRTQIKHHNFSSTAAGARPTISNILCTVIEEVRTIFAPPNFLIWSLVSPQGAIENL